MYIKDRKASVELPKDFSLFFSKKAFPKTGGERLSIWCFSEVVFRDAFQRKENTNADGEFVLNTVLGVAIRGIRKGL